MKFSAKRLVAFSNTAERYLAHNGTDTKLRYAIGRVQNQLRTLQEQLQARLTDIEIDCCEVDEKGIITRDDKGNLQFTREGLKRRNQLQAAVLEEEIFDVEPHFVEELPADIGAQELAVFTDLVFRPDEGG